MKKNEFKKMMKKENKAFKNYYVYEMIFILLSAIIVIPNIILTINNMIPFNITIINTLLIIIVALPIIVLDIKNDTVSKCEQGLSVPDAEMLISISEVFDTPVSTILGENIDEQEKNDLKVISEKLEVINEQLSKKQKQKRNIFVNTLIIADVCLILLFILLALLGSPYQNWDYSNPEWAVIGTIWHSFEWVYFKVAPFMIVVITVIGVILVKRNK